MKSEDDNFERNISRLVKRVGDSSEPSKAFCRSLTDSALGELKRQRSSGPAILKAMVAHKWINAIAAVVVIAFAVVVAVVVLRQAGKSHSPVPTKAEGEVLAEVTNTLVSGESAGKSESRLADADNIISLAKGKRVQGTGTVAFLASKSERRSRAKPPDKEKIAAEAKQIREMATFGDVEGLIEMLSVGQFPSKVAAAEYLGEIGDDRALPELERLNEKRGGWVLVAKDYDTSGAFAVAICRILMWDLPEDEQIEALFDLLEGRGPAVPEEVKERTVHYNFDVGKRVAAELDKFDDPSIIARLRRSENNGAAATAVWMEVRDMDVESAIARCAEIARDEGGAQRYGAIHCLHNFGADAIDALHELTFEGHREAVTVLAYQKENVEVLELICWHLTNNKSSHVRLRAVHTLYGGQTARPGVVPALIEALYDPLKSVRRNAAQLLSYAAYYKKTEHLGELEQAMLIAQKHPDQEVREYAAKALERLGSQRLDEDVSDPPPFRTDLEVGSRPPLTAEQELRAKTEPLEKEAAKFLQMGPPEEAIELYEQLLEFRPDYEPYVKALEKARAYIKAAAETTEKWYPDAPYIGLKGRYSYLLAREPDDMSTLKEEFGLALFLSGDGFDGWSNIFGENPKGRDQYEKALKLYEHIVEYYPQNEYKVIRAKAELGGLKLNLYKDAEGCVLAYTDIFALPVEEVVDSTDQRRNKPLETAGGKTQAQLDFERYYRDHLRARTIELCCSAVRSTPPRLGRYGLFGDIIQRCAKTDPKIVEMARAAKIKLEQQLKAEAERERMSEPHR